MVSYWCYANRQGISNMTCICVFISLSLSKKKVFKSLFPYFLDVFLNLMKVGDIAVHYLNMLHERQLSSTPCACFYHLPANTYTTFVCLCSEMFSIIYCIFNYLSLLTFNIMYKILVFTNRLHGTEQLGSAAAER